jgi:hypothetical protein
MSASRIQERRDAARNGSTLGPDTSDYAVDLNGVVDGGFAAPACYTDRLGLTASDLRPMLDTKDCFCFTNLTMDSAPKRRCR